MATTEEKDKTQQAIEDAEAKKKAARDAANATELAKLKETQQAESNALSQYNAAQYSNVGQILADVQSEIDKANIKDEKAIKRENAFRYIAGLGDTLSGLANLVGVAHGAANQPQTYHGSKIVEKAEQARKERKLEIDALNKRLDEMKAREREMKAAGSLQEVQLNIQHQKEQLELRRKNAEAERAQANADRSFAEKQRQFDETNQRLKEAAAAENASREAIKQKELDARLAAQAAKNAADPKYQAQVLQSNITGIRDEIARSMGYTSYNDYLRYQNVTGWGKDLDGKRNKETKRIREERAARNPEAKDFLDKLMYPESLTEQDIRMLMGASKVFSDAVNSAAVAESRAGAEAGGQTPKTASGRDWSNRKDSSGGA